jgi:excisionase family DNA binding protein
MVVMIRHTSGSNLLYGSLRASQVFCSIERTQRSSGNNRPQEHLLIYRVMLCHYTDMPDDPEFLTAEQVAEKLQLHPRTVRRLLVSGELPGKRIGGREWRVSATALRAFMESPDNPKPPEER